MIRSPVPFTIRGLAVSLLAAALAPAAVVAQSSKPITLEVLSPKLGILNPILPPQFLPVELPGGWPLTVRLTSNNEIGVGMRGFPPFFPDYQDTGFLVFADPDGCPSFSAIPGPGCAGAPFDETLLEFTNDTDQPGLTDFFGNELRQLALTDTGGGGRPKVFVFNTNTGNNNLLTGYGPATGGPNPDTLVSKCVGSRIFSGCNSDADCPAGSTCQPVPEEFDGYGHGADDDLPGWVLLSNRGVGIVLDESFNLPPGPLRHRNLAGFLTNVSWEFNDSTKHSSVVAHMMVPRDLLTQVIQFDGCVGPGDIPNCGGASLYRVDGGAPTTAPTLDVVTTLRMFAVNGTAPSILSDLDGNGVVDSKDATQAGYTLLSREAVLRIRHSFAGQSAALPLIVDLDGNHKVAFPPSPGAGGGITKVPR